MIIEALLPKMRGWQRAAGAQRSAGWERTTLLSKKHQFELSQRVGELCRHGGALKRLGSPVPFAETSPHFLKCGQSVKSTYYINIVGIERCGIPSIVCTSAPLLAPPHTAAIMLRMQAALLAAVVVLAATSSGGVMAYTDQVCQPLICLCV
jgi:hypothetical protein